MGKGLRVPMHRRHASGNGVVTLSGRDYYTGAWESPDADAEYRRLIAEFLATGLPPRKRKQRGEGITLGRICARYALHVLERYTKRGKPTSYALGLAAILREVEASHGHVAAGEFGPVALAAIRSGWVQPGRDGSPARMARATANQWAKGVVEMYGWAVAGELIPAAPWEALRALGPLTPRDGGRGVKRVQGVPLAVVEATLPAVPRPGPALVRLLLASGMRPSEACSIRPCDLDTSGDVWVYRVADDWNKTEWVGKARTVYLGPRSQAILRPLLAAASSPTQYLFRASVRCDRSGNRPYQAKSLSRAIERACAKTGQPHWHAYQLRHTALTQRYAKLGILAARATGGHAKEATTLGYIDDDHATAEERDAARRAALEMG